MNLDELLTAEAKYPSLPPAAYEATRDAVVQAARDDVTRRAKVVRRRRGRRMLAGLAAAAVAGVAVLSQTGGPANNAPVARQPGGHPPVTQAHFKTVAQVVAAAAAATGRSSGPGATTSFPYWRVITGTRCGGPAGDYWCDLTMWVGNGRAGAMADGTGEITATCPGTATIDGQTLPWSDINARDWTDAQVATLVADNSAADKSGRPPSDYYVMKNAIGLLTYTPASPTIRKQLWRELAGIRGIRLDGRRRDSLGRIGWRLTLSSPQAGYGTQSLLVDTSTGMVLEQSDQAPGGPRNVTTVRSAGPVDTAPVPTLGALKPMC